MKKRSLAGNVAIGLFLFCAVCVVVSFFYPAWLVSDRRITSAKMQKIGLWEHCFRSLPNPERADSPDRFYVGCRWIYDPLTAGYDKIRGFLLPGFMVTTQFFYTICFLSFVVSVGLVIVYATCWTKEHPHYVDLIKVIACLLLIGSISGCIGVLVFALFGNSKGWMPDQENNFIGWAYVVACVGSILGIVVSILFFVEANIQEKKRKKLKESQTRFTLEARA
ncbi:hypothetical protein QAD02_022375 [Eretmocerus hayati]|uniref:Uncharacterized protein n=1 Tax=Eretmocerus hayati TaxID=131215 RepID=A0ACC2PUG6_9HYME|nr:hypothetical protein QAD02_022375 [Eretmocerus hayati]